MCTSRGREAERRARVELASFEPRRSTPAGPFRNPHDLVVEVVVPGRPARREVADEERRPRRAVVRPEEHPEAPRSGRLRGARGVDADDDLARAERRVPVGLRGRLSPARRRAPRRLARSPRVSPARTSAADPSPSSAGSPSIVRSPRPRRRRGGSRAPASRISSASSPDPMAGERKRRVGDGGYELERGGRMLHAGERS